MFTPWNDDLMTPLLKRLAFLVSGLGCKPKLVSFLPTGSLSCNDPEHLRPGSRGDGAEGLGGWHPEGRVWSLRANHLPRSGHRPGAGHW